MSSLANARLYQVPGARSGAKAEARWLACWPQDDAEEIGTIEDATAEEIGQFIDDDLENDNYHAVVGVGCRLAGVLVAHAGKQIADKVMQEFAKAGGVLRI